MSEQKIVKIFTTEQQFKRSGTDFGGGCGG